MNENTAELAVRAWFESMRTSVVRGTELAASDVVSAGGLLKQAITASLARLNPKIPSAELDRVASSLKSPPHPTLIENNRWFHNCLINGAKVEFRDENSGEMRGGTARLIDFDRPATNELLVVQQLTVPTTSGRSIRPDYLLYINGVPLVAIELKDPANEGAPLDVAIDQLGRYKAVAPDLFVPNLLLVASDGLLTRVGSITSGRQRFMPWRPASGGEPTLEALIRELLNPAALLDYLRSCVAFEEDERGNIVKKVAGYHQFRAVRKARARVIGAIKTPDRKRRRDRR